MHLPCQEWNKKLWNIFLHAEHLDWGIVVHIWRHINIFFFVFASEALSASVWYVSEMRFTAAERKRKRGNEQRESLGSSIWVTLCWRRRQSDFPPAIQRHITQHIKTRHLPLTHNPPHKQERLQNDQKYPENNILNTAKQEILVNRYRQNQIFSAFLCKTHQCNATGCC